MDEQSNAHSQRGYYVKKDGSTGTVEDVWFDNEIQFVKRIRQEILKYL